MNGQNALNKLSRSLSNLVFGFTEIPATISEMNDRHGNSGLMHGVVFGVGRTIARLGVGVYEFTTFPAPTYRGSFASPLPSVVPWVQGGYEELPPELGFESRFNYGRSTLGYSRLP